MHCFRRFLASFLLFPTTLLRKLPLTADFGDISHPEQAECLQMASQLLENEGNLPARETDPANDPARPRSDRLGVPSAPSARSSRCIERNLFLQNGPAAITSRRAESIELHAGQQAPLARCLADQANLRTATRGARGHLAARPTRGWFRARPPKAGWTPARGWPHALPKASGANPSPGQRRAPYPRLISRCSTLVSTR